MTNIQAINLLKGLWQSLDDYCELNDEGKAAFCMAIEALSCSEFPNSSDCISRQAAIDALKGLPTWWADGGGYYGGAQPPMVALLDPEDAVSAIENLPSEQPERKTGEWIERNPRNSPNCRLIECSECGNAYIVGYNIDYDDWIDGRNFCMKCGADLRGGSNDKST